MVVRILFSWKIKSLSNTNFQWAKRALPYDSDLCISMNKIFIQMSEPYICKRILSALVTGTFFRCFSSNLSRTIDIAFLGSHKEAKGRIHYNRRRKTHFNKTTVRILFKTVFFIISLSFPNKVRAYWSLHLFCGLLCRFLTH